MKMLAGLSGETSEVESVLWVEALILRSIDSRRATEIGNAMAHLFGRTPVSYGRKLKHRRQAAASSLTIALSTLRSEYETGLCDLISWALVSVGSKGCSNG